MNKSTKRRLITSIICFTACASLVGVGFSLWTAGSGTGSATGEGDLVTDDFSKIKINNSISVDPFCQDGFLTEYNDGYKLIYTGKIYELIEFDLTEFVRSTDTYFDVTATLTSQHAVNGDIPGFDFSNAKTLSYGHGSSSNNLKFTDGTLPSGTTLTQTFTSDKISSSETNYYFAINIGIAVSEAAKFKADVYDKLIDRTFKLNITYTIR